MTTTWTPGPWLDMPQGISCRWAYNIIGPSGGGLVSLAKTAADARLIAQAPAMAEALRAFFDAYKDHPERLGTSSAAAIHLETARAILRAIESA